MALKWFSSLTLNTLLLLQKQTTLFVPIESLTTGQWGSKFLIGYCFLEGKIFFFFLKCPFFFTTPLWNVKETIPSISWLINPLIVWPPFWYQIILWLFFISKLWLEIKVWNISNYKCEQKIVVLVSQFSHKIIFMPFGIILCLLE